MRSLIYRLTDHVRLPPIYILAPALLLVLVLALQGTSALKVVLLAIGAEILAVGLFWLGGSVLFSLQCWWRRHRARRSIAL